CGSYYAYETVSNAVRCPHIPVQERFHVQTRIQAEVACSLMPNCRSYQLTRYVQARVRTSAETIVSMDLFSVSVYFTPEASNNDLCPPDTELVRLETLPNRGSYFDPATKCATAYCPLAHRLPANNPRTRSANSRGEIGVVCNIDVCPECACNPASGQCTCGPLWTGEACQWYKPEWCCSPPMPYSPMNNPSLVCMDSRTRYNTAGVCGYEAGAFNTSL